MWLPCAKNYLDKERNKAQADFSNRVKSKRKNQVHKLPDTAWKEETIMRRIKEGKQDADKHFKEGGRMSGGVYTT